MASASRNKVGRFLPKEFDIAHELCFVIHDLMVQIIKSGEEGKMFFTKIDLNDEQEKESLNKTDNIFAWLESQGRLKDRSQILKTTVLPAVLSDMMHCVFESLESSRKAKLGITYMLIRKPLQESLYLLEAVVLDELEFAETLAVDPLRLRSKNAGGLEGHELRIKKVINIIGQSTRLDAKYITGLRYDKWKEDSFDGICNQAMHLFTEHKAIRTENLNINFIFSGWDEKLMQWAFFYSRLPYLLFYTHKVVEHIVNSIAPTTQEYLDDIERRISALIILWWEGVDEDYRCDQLLAFVNATEAWLNVHCKSAGFKTPNKKELLRMSVTGAYPKESMSSVKERNAKYELHALINKMAAK